MNSTPQPDYDSRLKHIDKAALLGRLALFKTMNRWELFLLGQVAKLLEYRRGEVVYSEQDTAHHFYIIVSGRFEAYVWREGQKRTLAYFKRGDYFGEIALLTDTAHSATVQALSDSVVFQLKKEDFKKILEKKPKVSLELSRHLGNRLKASDPRHETLLKTEIVSVVDLELRIDPSAFAVNLASSLSRESSHKTILVDLEPEHTSRDGRFPPAPTVPLKDFYASEHRLPESVAQHIVYGSYEFDFVRLTYSSKDQNDEHLFMRLLNMLSASYRHVLLNLPTDSEDPVMLKALDHSDFVFFFTTSELGNLSAARERIQHLEERSLLGKTQGAVVIEEALMGVSPVMTAAREVFIRHRCFILPQGRQTTASDRGSHKRLPFVAENPDGDYAKAVRHIARFVNHSLVGLALGSGAALGLAHIGVLKILEKEKIPIDIIAGSSIGSLIGSLYAIGRSADQIEADFTRELGSKWKMLRLLDFSLWPFTGVLHGTEALHLLKKYYKNMTFEHCRIALKIVAANLSTAETVVYDSGSILDAVRASISIPAIFKPVLTRDGVVIDGGIFSPLPVDTLRQAGASKIIAVNVFPNSADIWQKRILEEALKDKKLQSLHQQNLWQKVKYRVNKRAKRIFSPNVVDVLMNTIQQMESVMAEGESLDADIVIKPVMPQASWVDFYKTDAFIRKGEEETQKLLPRIRELVVK